MQSLRLSFVVACASLVGCGDDATSASEGSESSTGGPAESSGTMPADTSSSSEGGTADVTTVVADTSTSVVDESSSSSSSTGEPNNPPIAVDDRYVMSMADTPLGITADLGVLVNDSDPDGDAITVDDFDAMSSAGGTVAIAADGAFTYTPLAGFWGEDGFDYTIIDDGGATASAHVRVVVAPTTVSLGEVTNGVGGFMIEGTAAGDQAGYAVAGGGDINGDGRADAIIGAYTADVVGSSEGRVFVAYGKDDGTSVSAMDLVEGYGGFVIDGIADFDRTGYSVAHAGDVNGDGLADIVIGAPQANAVTDDEGMAFVVFGKTDQDPVPLATLAADGAGFVINGIAVDDLAGSAVGGGADVNGDGLDDVIVGAPQANGNAVGNSGRVFVVHGKADTTAVALGDVATGAGGFVIEGIASEDRAGDAVAGAGDVNGDGLEDIVVGVPLANAGATNTGRTYVIFGRTATTAMQLSSVAGGNGGFAIDGTAALDQAGDAVAGAGDVDGDGLADVILGAPGAENGADLQGRSYVVLGKDDGTLVTCEDLAMG
ncbi:MAG TPA: Ig-like domain-containing protein, partial [Nannocystaceae bacterium]|nr:Ig-like domain-containing protein [Nannocystaceae bacterium]